MYKILYARDIAPKEFDFLIEAPEIASHAKPGQFVITRHGERGERIPLTVADFDPIRGTIRLIFQVVGRATAEMASLREGDFITDVAGPLGTPSDIERLGTVMAVGGGVGIAALFPIIRGLKETGNKVITILGGRTSELVIMKDECGRYSDELIITTDDGSEGQKGLVTDAMKFAASRGERIDRCWAIGPTVMMKFCSFTASELGIPIWVSMNPIMIDGTGMCGGCRLSVGGKIKFGCVDGPEFDGAKVNWDEFMNRMGQYRDEEKISMERYETGVALWR
ncbi:MAG: sulfide/dihydroorotate dehydrogenase-like FAD/NAD-binding protein [Synergistaceae bacterium]|jgi:ferredoxin--NADP+ reductase|nr:sulfide/dihydroorotate dehydrogenase-like FAD/NAD-binding protein [Synergistaceae bacterium]